MKASDYRREYSAYRSACERAGYDFYSGRAPRLDLAPVRERFADLWTREAVADLARARDETPATFETERAALAALTNAARLGYAERRAREVSEELMRCESATSFEWEGERVEFGEVAERSAADSDAGRQRELFVRRLDTLRACDDLRAARLEALDEAGRELNFGKFGSLLAEATHTDFEKLAADARVLLERTAPHYAAPISRWVARHLPPASARAPDYSDSLFFARLSHLDEFFPARGARAAFEATLGGLGIRVEPQGNLRVEESARAGAGRARCFAVKPPEDVRLVFAARAGADFRLRFFQEAAGAQQFAWASRELAARYPEFVHTTDRANTAGFGFLFRFLFTDAAWVARHANVTVTAAREIASACALVELHDTRRACALVLSLTELFGAADARSEALAETYAARQHEATSFRHPASLHLFDTLGEGLRAAEDLRARLFASTFGEHLRTRHGTRWWGARRAGDELIDAWNTASRYTVEELAALLGAGRLDLELLADTLTAALDVS